MNPEISIIVAVKNEEKNLPPLFNSLRKQTFQNFETIIIDNNSSDKTKEVATSFTDKVFNIGPERSAQRSYGVKSAQGKYVLILDADMILDENVLQACIDEVNTGSRAVIINEKGAGFGFWSECRKLEKSFYFDNVYINAARFYEKKLFEEINGYDATLVSGEDWDLSQRAGKNNSITFAKNAFIHHAISEPGLIGTVKKKFYYGKHIGKYSTKKVNEKSVSNQMSVFYRYTIYFDDLQKLFSNPFLGFGMLFLKTVEFGALAAGYLYAKFI